MLLAALNFLRSIVESRTTTVIAPNRAIGRPTK